MKEEIYWRYKKKTPPKDEFADMNGPVKVVRPPVLTERTCKTHHVSTDTTEDWYAHLAKFH